MKLRLAFVTTTLALLVVALSPQSAGAFGNGSGGHSGGGHAFGGHSSGGHSGWAPHGGGGWGGWHGGDGWRHDGHHFYGGVGFGFWGPYWDPWLWGWDYPYYYDYAPSYPAYVAPNTLPAPPPSYWYYCPSVKGYYPYVPQCPESWVPVTPTPQ